MNVDSGSGFIRPFSEFAALIAVLVVAGVVYMLWAAYMDWSETMTNKGAQMIHWLGPQIQARHTERHCS